MQTEDVVSCCNNTGFIRYQNNTARYGAAVHFMPVGKIR